MTYDITKYNILQSTLHRETLRNLKVVVDVADSPVSRRTAQYSVEL